jgi:phage terminase large subunit GpA-like protein
MQALKWGNLRWPDGQPKKAEYLCERHGCVIQEHHKTQMLAGGQWQHDFAERADEIIGFHVNCLYTPIGLGDTWAENATVWERSKRDPAKVKVFQNTRLGETTKDPNEKLDWELIRNRREPFSLRVIPRGVLLLTAGVDVQKDRLELQILGWTKPGRAVTVDYRIIEGDPTRAEVWNDLDEILAGEFVSAGGVKMRLSLTLVDSGYLQEFVIGFTRTRKARGIFAAKGASAFAAPAIGRPSYVDAKGKASVKLDPRGARQYQIGVNALKEALHGKLRADSGTEESPVQPGDRHFRFSDQLPEEYFRQLCAEVYDPHKRRWIKVYERNEVLDTMIYAMAAALHHAVAVDRMSEADWARLEQMYEPAGGAPPTHQAQPRDPAPRRVSASGARDGGFGSADWNL